MAPLIKSPAPSSCVRSSSRGGRPTAAKGRVAGDKDTAPPPLTLTLTLTPLPPSGASGGGAAQAQSARGTLRATLRAALGAAAHEDPSPRVAGAVDCAVVSHGVP